jgi:hypothetical protein
VRARNQGQTTKSELRIVAPDQRLFDVTGLRSVFAMFTTLDEALAASNIEPGPRS